MTSISLVETDLIDKKIEIILGQTDYTTEIAREKLLEHNFNEIEVIKSYFGIPNKKSKEIVSVNQEIYKQLRIKMNVTCNPNANV